MVHASMLHLGTSRQAGRHVADARLLAAGRHAPVLPACANHVEGVPTVPADVCLLVLPLCRLSTRRTRICSAALTVHILDTGQAMGRTVSAEDFHTALISGAEFVEMMMKADSVAKCAVPPGMPGMVDTTLKGFTGLGSLLRLGASHWCVQARAPDSSQCLL
jgi:hypothetical protein